MRPLALLFGSCTVLFPLACGPAQPQGGPGAPLKPPGASAEAGAADPASEAPPLAVKPRGDVTVTLLYTTDEHGWLESLSEGGVSRGGAAELLGRLVKYEGHCPGPVPAGIEAAGALTPAAPEDCTSPRTLLLSGGDNFTGPAISTYFNGVSMASAMGRMGYAASAFGNHEFDFGVPQFSKLRDLARLHYLAANVKIDDAKLAGELAIRRYEVFERKGVKIGVVGLAAAETLKAAMAERFRGITFEPTEASLDRAIHEARETGAADVVVVTAHECPDDLVPIVTRHPEWQLAFVGGGHCHRKIDARAGDTPVITPGWRLHQYARVAITINPNNPPRARVVTISHSIVDVAADPQAPADPPLARLVTAWRTKVDSALGKVIGYSEGGIGPEEAVGKIVSDAWLHELGGDVAIMNRGGVRQTIPRGPISHATIWSVLPFDNRLVKVSIDGASLAQDLEAKSFIISGAKRAPNGNWSVGGKPMDPKKRYTVIITDFMYGGGDGAVFAARDPKPVGTGVSWRDPVIAWIEKKKSAEAGPLERKLHERPAPAGKQSP
ncbi:bifunctional metallophosphatase/5'-nucleotidase [Sorangium sp. So ce128]|uniref:bifunctional metallophosphatase/5'-nucleotidase n=1 Tax=Sorangium sp. So ce128 TaxID=3133281 RepID=UPI003F620808